MADDNHETVKILISRLRQLRPGANLMRVALVQISNAVANPPGPIGAMMTKSFMALQRPDKPEQDTTPV
jgi:hypothetical protein